MQYTIRKSPDLSFYVDVFDASREDLTKVRRTLDLILGVEQEHCEGQRGYYPYVDMSTFNPTKLKALYDAAKLYYAERVNIIFTIKHIRALTDCDLKQGKQLVDYAVGNTPIAPEWWKEPYE